MYEQLHPLWQKRGPLKVLGISLGIGQSIGTGIAHVLFSGRPGGLPDVTGMEQFLRCISSNNNWPETQAVKMRIF